MPSAILVREATWNTVRRVFSVVGQTTIGGAFDDVDVGVDGPLAVVEWREGEWRIRPCSKSVTVDGELLADEIVLRHAQQVAHRDLGNWRLRFLIGERDQLLDELRHVESVTDLLTGLLNRRVAYRMIEQMTTGVVMMIDIDRLKRINDEFGMLAGDTILQRTAAILRGHVEWPNIVARYGGEEFIALVPHAELEEARALAEQIRAWADAPFTLFEGEVMATLSIGLARHRGHATTALREADEALRQAKEQGRNRVVG